MLSSFIAAITAERLIAAASLISAVGIFLLFKQIRDDHERSRREKAISLLSDWSQHLKESASAARRFCERLDQDQAHQLYKMESLSVSASLLDQLHHALTDMKIQADDLKKREAGGLIPLTRDEILHIRWNVVTYMDMLEALTSAWWHHVADRRMIEEQFRFLVDKNQRYTLLKNLREAAGGTRAFPSLDAFVKRLEELENPPVAPPYGVLGRLWPLRLWYGP